MCAGSQDDGRVKFELVTEAAIGVDEEKGPDRSAIRALVICRLLGMRAVGAMVDGAVLAVVSLDG